MRITNNGLAQQTRRILEDASEVQDRSTVQLSSGNRINQSADDPAGLAISEKLKSRIKSNRQANRNANDGISLIQVAEGSLASIHSLGARLKEIAIQSASDTLSDNDRVLANNEFQELKKEIERVTNNSQFNGMNVLKGDKIYEFQVGLKGSQVNDRIGYDLKKSLDAARNSGLASLAVSSKGSAQNAIDDISQFTNNISSARANLGSIQARLQSASHNLDTENLNESNSNSKIRDTDIAEIASVKASNDLRMTAATKMLDFSNSSLSSIEKLVN